MPLITQTSRSKRKSLWHLEV